VFSQVTVAKLPGKNHISGRQQVDIAAGKARTEAIKFLLADKRSFRLWRPQRRDVIGGAQRRMARDIGQEVAVPGKAQASPFDSGWPKWLKPFT
jgi:hypothetical protein